MISGKRVGVYVLFIGVFIVVAEAIALLMLYRNIANYKHYWQKKAQQPGELTYVALGDSAAQGLGASSAQKGYVGLIAERLAQKSGKSVKIINVSKSGAKVSDVLQDQLPMIKRINADLVTIEIGANDVASFNEKQFVQEFTALTKKLPADTYVSNMPYFGSRPKGRPVAKRISELIKPLVLANPKLNFVDLQTITEERNSIRGYAADYFHPNNRAYMNWAEAFWNEIEETSK